MGTASTSSFVRYIAAILGGVLLILHAVLLRGGDTERLIVVNTSLWFFSAFCASLVCATVALGLKGPQSTRERQAWWLLTAGTGSWALGQIGWTFAQFVPALSFPYPGPKDFLFFGFVPLSIAGLLRLPKPQTMSDFSTKHFCNLALLFCVLVTSMVIALWEPARASALPTSQILVHASYCLSIGCVLIVALYLMWSYHWQATWLPLVLIALGAGVYTSNDIYYLRLLVADQYGLDHWVNLAWTLMFVLVACGAYEQHWRNRHPQSPSERVRLARERWLEAVMPGLLMLIVVAVATVNVSWLSSSVLSVCAVSAVFFATMLAVREYHIQKEEQRLLAALNDSHTELEQRVAERTVELDSAYRELEGFSYAVAHDIKSPLRAMNGFGALLQQEYASRLDTKGLDYVERIRRGALTLSQLVDDLLAYTRVERLELQRHPTNIAELVANCLVEHKDEIEQTGALVSARVEPFVLNIDGQALMQSIRNLLQNALKFSRHAEPPHITIASERRIGKGDIGSVLISIRDNGIGFDMQYHDKIFALFQRLHRADEYIGTGIGLSIARKAVERMGGRVWAESSLGNGATFFVELPFV